MGSAWDWDTACALSETPLLCHTGQVTKRSWACFLFQGKGWGRKGGEGKGKEGREGEERGEEGREGKGKEGREVKIQSSALNTDLPCKALWGGGVAGRKANSLISSLQRPPVPCWCSLQGIALNSPQKFESWLKSISTTTSLLPQSCIQHDWGRVRRGGSERVRRGGRGGEGGKGREGKE